MMMMFAWKTIWRHTKKSWSKLIWIHQYTTIKNCFPRFFLLMGSVFTFVSSDVRTKLDILYEHRQQDTGSEKHFDSIKTMILYEKGASLLRQKGYVSGSRTLLRLHRGLGSCFTTRYHLFVILYFYLQSLCTSFWTVCETWPMAIERTMSASQHTTTR